MMRRGTSQPNEGEGMAVLMILEWPDTPAETYERVNEVMGIQGAGDAPDGLIEHIAALDGDDIVICDVWESREALEAFFENRLGDALREVGVAPSPPRIMDVHNRLEGKGDDAGVLVLIDVPDFGVDTYDQMTESMDAHVMGEHPSVAHTAALRDDGGVMVVDVWSSPEAFGEFAQSQIAPAGEQAGLPAFEPRMIPVQNRIRGKAAATG
jgi:heme-degrading monooxygenase HmoA